MKAAVEEDDEDEAPEVNLVGKILPRKKPMPKPVSLVTSRSSRTVVFPARDRD